MTSKTSVLTPADIAAAAQRKRQLAEIDADIRAREARADRRAFARPDEGMSLTELERMVWPDESKAAQAREDKAQNDEVEETLDTPDEDDIAGWLKD